MCEYQNDGVELVVQQSTVISIVMIYIMKSLRIIPMVFMIFDNTCQVMKFSQIHIMMGDKSFNNWAINTMAEVSHTKRSQFSDEMLMKMSLIEVTQFLA